MARKVTLIYEGTLITRDCIIYATHKQRESQSDSRCPTYPTKKQCEDHAKKVVVDEYIMTQKSLEYNYGKSRKYLTDSSSLQSTLEKYGVAIIPTILTTEECEEMLSGMGDYIEHITQDWSEPNKPVKRDDKSTWREFYKLIPLHSMLMQHFGVGHAQVAWTLRENPKIVNIFAELWDVKPEELLVSFDGMSFNFPPEETNRGYYRPKKSEHLIGTKKLETLGNAWLHTDQSYTNNEYMCVQS